MLEDGKHLPILEDLSEESKAHSLLKEVGFADWKTARTVLQQLELQDQQGLSAIFPFLMAALGSAADPDRSLVNLERFAGSYGAGLFCELKKKPRVIEILITLFSASPFLTEILLRTPDVLDLLNNRQSLTERKTIEQFQNEALSVSHSFETDDERLDALRRYQRRELLRIGTSDFLGLYDLRSVLSQLSRIAIGLVRVCLSMASQQTGTSTSGFVILAMGKLGGWELNYSSDIDLLFIARSNPDNCLNLAKQLIKNITYTTPEGFLYRVDLRLRPWGNDGPLITTLDGYLQYIQEHAR